MKVLIIEDELPASRRLIRLLGEVSPATQVIDVLPSVEKSISWFNTHPNPDLIFVDIQLEDGLSFEIWETCRIDVPVIFTTAYDVYTLRAFKLNSVDYLLKPIDVIELKQAIHKFNTYHRSPAYYSRLESILCQFQPKTKERFLIRIGEYYRSVPTSTIQCFYIRERCCFLLTETGKNYPLDYSLDKIEQLLEPSQFFRINRNYIIRYQAIRDILAYSSNRLKINLTTCFEEDIIVSRDRVSAFKEWIDR